MTYLLVPECTLIAVSNHRNSRQGEVRSIARYKSGLISARSIYSSISLPLPPREREEQGRKAACKSVSAGTRVP
jgi:hypothetical protein